MNYQHGFSIIEVISTLVLMGVVAIMLAPYYQSGITGSVTPIVRMEAAAQLQGSMESIMSAYREYWTNTGEPYEILSTEITALQSRVAGGEFTPSGSDITVTQNQIVQLYTYTSGLDADLDQNQSLIVTLHHDDGGTLTYIFPTGENFNLR